MEGSTFVQVDLRRRNLRRAFAPRFAARLTGTAVRSLERRGKFLIAALSSDEVLVMHLGMSGSFHVGQSTVSGDTADPHDHVVFAMSSGMTITYNDPRRFGSMDLLVRGRPHATVRRLGPEPLDASFNGDALAQACAGKRTSIKAALLDQAVVAGLGNIYASEALHRAGISPKRLASVLATPGGRPRPIADRLVTAIKAVLGEAIERTTTAKVYRGERFRVYERDGHPCTRKGCGGTIARITQAGRSTYYCATCQR